MTKHSSKTTTSHRTIKKWAEARCGRPAMVKGTAQEGEVGLLRIDFPGHSGKDTLQEIEWNEFFEKFDEKNLAFIYQDTTADGSESRFCKFVSRDSDEHKAHANTSTSNDSAHVKDTRAHNHKSSAKESSRK